MLIQAVLSPSTANAVQGLDEIHTLAQVTTRERDAATLLSELGALSQVTPDVLLIAVDVGPPDALVAGLRQYRAVQPHVRIVLLAPGRQPGDPLISTLVGLGIYDIVADPDLATALRTVLDSPPATYAQAVRWHNPTLPETSTQPGAAPKVQEREILRVMASRDRPLVIAVTGVTPASGTTTLAWTLATELARRGISVALLLDLPPNEIEALADHQDPGLSLTLYSASPTSDAPADRLAVALERGHDADLAIVDAGALREAAATDPHLLTLSDQLLVCWPQSLPRLTRVSSSLWPTAHATETQRIIRHTLEHGIHLAYLCPPGQADVALQLVQGLLAHMLPGHDHIPIVPVPIRPAGLDLAPLLARLAPAQHPHPRMRGRALIAALRSAAGLPVAPPSPRAPLPRLLSYLVLAALIWLTLGLASLARLPLPPWLHSDLPASLLRTLLHLH